MKTLVFLINETDKSKELIRFAALFAKDINAKVDVLHIQYPQAYGSYGYMGSGIAQDPELLQTVSDEVKTTVDEFIRDIETENSGIPSIEFKSELGIASKIIENKVAKGVYDMVMLQGQSEESIWKQNTKILDVVRNVSCPVWFLSPDARYHPMKKIVYATDYSEEDISTIKRLIDLTKPYDSEILALHISNDETFEKRLRSEGFTEMLSKETGSNKITVKMIADEDGKDAVEVLVGEAEKAKANLIVVLKENRNFFERLFKSSFTAELVKKAQLPILIFPE
jgi:nucleotide-binding universal stress UspA family protein